MGIEGSTGEACLRNSDCGDTARCADGGICVELLSAECPEIAWPEERDDAVFIGSIMPSGATFTTPTQPLENAVRLAVEDFNDTTALRGGRQIAWVRCDDGAGTDSAVAAADHLSAAVGAAAIVGPTTNEHVLALAEATVAAGVFVITPTATASSISDIDDDQLVWRAIPSDVQQANAIVDRLRDLDDAGGVANLLVLAKDDAYGNGILSATLADLESDLPAVTHATYPDPATYASQEELLAAYEAVLDSVVSNGPFTHVLFIGTSEVQLLLYRYLGMVWDGTPQSLPLFTVTHGAVPELERFIDEIGVAAGTDALVPAKPLIEAKLEGVSPVALDFVNFNAFGIRYQIRYADESPPPSAALAYDATLAALLATCTIPADDDVHGEAIADAMPRLASNVGTPISFGGTSAAFVGDACEVLADDGSVDLQGVSGALDWDLGTGDVRANVWGWSIEDRTGDGSSPTAIMNRIYCLDPAPAAHGVWQGPEASPASCE